MRRAPAQRQAGRPPLRVVKVWTDDAEGAATYSTVPLVERMTVAALRRRVLHGQSVPPADSAFYGIVVRYGSDGEDSNRSERVPWPEELVADILERDDPGGERGIYLCLKDRRPLSVRWDDFSAAKKDAGSDGENEAAVGIIAELASPFTVERFSPLSSPDGASTATSVSSVRSASVFGGSSAPLSSPSATRFFPSSPTAPSPVFSGGARRLRPRPALRTKLVRQLDEPLAVSWQDPALLQCDNIEAALFHGVEDGCSHVGILERACFGKESTWHPRYCMLDLARLWYCGAEQEHSGLSYYTLTRNSEAVEHPLAPRCFSLSTREGVFHFRAPTEDAMREWITRVRNRAVGSSADGMLFDLEKEISRGASEACANDVELIRDACSLSGALINPVVRDHLLDFISNDEVENCILFWAHAEAYRKRFSRAPSGGAGVSASADAGLHHFFAVPAKPFADAAPAAKHVFDAFLAGDAPHPIPVSATERQDLAAAVGTPTVDIFCALQDRILASLQSKTYVSFLETTEFRKVLTALPHACTRRILSKPALRRQRASSVLIAPKDRPIHRRVHATAATCRIGDEAESAGDEEYSKWHYGGNVSSPHENAECSQVSRTRLRSFGSMTIAAFRKLRKQSKDLEREWYAMEERSRCKLTTQSPASVEAGEDFRADTNENVLLWPSQEWWEETMKTRAATDRLYLPPYCPTKALASKIRDASKGGARKSCDALHGRVADCTAHVQWPGHYLGSEKSSTECGRSCLQHGWISMRRLSKKRGGTSGKRSSGDWTRKFAAVRVENGHGVVYLFDKTGANRFGCFECSHLIDLDYLEKIRPAEDQLSSLIIEDRDGNGWLIRVEYSPEEGHHHHSARWLDVLSRWCDVEHDVVRIVRGGWLSKRGLINTGFRKRWMALDSAHMLRYYKDSSGLLRGEICMRTVHAVEWEEESEYFTILTDDRDWQLCAYSVAEAAGWVAALRMAKDTANDHIDEGAANQPCVRGLGDRRR